MKKAQVTVDFLIIFAIALIMFMLLFNMAIDKSRQFSMQSSQLYARQLADKIGLEINRVFLAGDGPLKSIILPETMHNNIDYSINFYPNNRLVEINYTAYGQRATYSSVLFTTQIHTNLTNFAGAISVINNNGEIIIS